MSQYMVIEEIEVAARQARNFGKRVIHGLRIEAPSACKECVLVAEVAVMRAAARNDDGVRDKVVGTLDEITPNGWYADQRALRRDVARTRHAVAEVGEESGAGVLGGPKKDRIGVPSRLFRQRGDVQAAECHVGAARAVTIG